MSKSTTIAFYFMIGKIARRMFFLWFLLLITISWSQSNKTVIKKYDNAYDKIVKKHVPFNKNNKNELYKSMDLLPRMIWGKLKMKLIFKKKSKLNNIAYLIAFYDLNKDKVSDQFVLQTKEGKVLNQEFGFIYDLNNDEKIDYIIYNGGSIITIDNAIYYYFYHWIDTDYNGKIDTVFFNNVLFSDESRLNSNNTLWIMDSDKNGKPDVVNFLNTKIGNTTPIKAFEGIWSYKTISKRTESVNSNNAQFFDPFSEFLIEINRLLNL